MFKSLGSWAALFFVCFMDFIIWNSQGEASKEFLRAVRFLVSSYKPCMLALLET